MLFTPQAEKKGGKFFSKRAWQSRSDFAQKTKGEIFVSSRTFLSGVDDLVAVQREMDSYRKEEHNVRILEEVGKPKSIFTKETASRLDKVKKYGKQSERIPGKRPSQLVLEDLGLRANRHFPRYEPAYEVIREAFPDFKWKTHEKSDGRRYVTYVGDPNPHVSLAERVLESYRRHLAEDGQDPFSQRIALNSFPLNVQNRVKPLLRDENGTVFARMLVEDVGISYPPMQVMESVAQWLYRALEGEPSTVVTPVCPDYETRDTGDPFRPREYTFTGLNSGVGYVAQRALRALPKVWEFFNRRRTNIRFVVAIGDFEAQSEETCRKVGVSYNEFIRRLRQSQHAFAQSCNGLPVETPLVTEIDPFLWKESITAAREAVSQGDYGALRLTEEDIEIIASARSSLYRRWYGDDVDCRNVLLRQAPEYMAMGRVSDKLPNALIIGADAVAMSPFLQGLSENIRPCVYLRNANY